MKPVRVYKAAVDVKDLLELSKNYLVKATDGKSTLLLQGRRIVAARGDPPEQKKEMVIALYAVHKKVRLNASEYFVNKVETRVSRNVGKDLEKIASSYPHVLVEVFSKRLKRISVVFKDGNLVSCDGNYSKLVSENKAVFDVYEVLKVDTKITREEVLQKFKLKEPTAEEIDRIIQHAFGDRVGGYYSP